MSSTWVWSVQKSWWYPQSPLSPVLPFPSLEAQPSMHAHNPVSKSGGGEEEHKSGEEDACYVVQIEACSQYCPKVTPGSQFGCPWTNVEVSPD